MKVQITFRRPFFFASLICLSTILLFQSCNKDEDCLETMWYQDNDNDGRGNPAISLLDCEQPEGYVNNDIDDDDTQPFLNDLYFQENINSTHISETYPVKIFLPGVYETNKNLPVLYVLDGEYFFDKIIEYTKDIEFDAIIVGVGDHTPNVHGQDHLRARDFIPGTIYDGVDGGHLNFYKFITEEVVPFIDQNYESDQNSRTLLGHQMAGVFVNFSLLKGASEDLFFHGYLSTNPVLTNRFILENMLDSLDFSSDHEKTNLFLSQVSATNMAEWFYSDLEAQNFSWLNMDLYMIEDTSTTSFNPQMNEPSIKEGLKFIYDL